MAAPEEEENVEIQDAGKKKKERPVRRLVVRECDVPPDIQKDIVEYAQEALDDQPLQKNQAQHVKTKLDKEHGGMWHVIVGTHFGGNVTNDAHSLLNFQLDNTWFLVFKSGPPEKPPQPAPGASTNAASPPPLKK